VLAFVAVLTYQVMVALAAAEEAVEAAVAHELTVWQCLDARPHSRHLGRHDRSYRQPLRPTPHAQTCQCQCLYPRIC
jgi:hypothetical protein